MKLKKLVEAGSADQARLICGAKTVTFIVASFGNFPGLAQLPLDSLGVPFNGTKVQITWSVQTNTLPRSLPIFKVLPTTFSPEIISNVVNIFKFQNPEKVRAALGAVADGQTVSYQEPYPGKPVFGKSIRICPTDGYIEYSNPTASSSPQTPVDAVPTQDRALTLAVNLLPRFGIDESELSKKGKQLEYFVQTNGHFDKQQKHAVQDVAVRGVILFRQINGVSFSGAGDCGGFRVSFGNKEEIKQLAVAWRNLKSKGEWATAGPTEIIELLRKGKGVIRLAENANIGTIKNLTITDARPYYLGFDGTEHQSIVYPYAMLTAKAETTVTNVEISLNCPILK